MTPYPGAQGAREAVDDRRTLPRPHTIACNPDREERDMFGQQQPDGDIAQQNRGVEIISTLSDQ